MKKVIALLSALTVLFSSICADVFTIRTFAKANELLITDCETLTGWNKTGGNRLDIHANGFTGNAVACNIDKGAFRTATYTASEPLDISDYQNIQWDVMMHSGGQPGMWDDIKNYYGDEVYLKIGSSESDYNFYRLSKMTVEQDANNSLWYHFSVDINDPTGTTGSFDKSKLSIFYFSTIDGAVNTSVRNGHIRIDNIYARNLLPEQPEEVEDTLLSECETTEGWSYANAGMMSVTPNGMTGSAININTSYGTLRKLTFAKDADLSAYNMLEFDLFCMKVGDVSYNNMWSDIAESYGDTIAVEVSDGSNQNTYGLNKWTVDALGNNWYHVRINLKDATTGSKLDLAKFKTFSVYTNTTGALDRELPDTTFRVDNLVAHYDPAADKPVNPENPDGVWPIPGRYDKTTTGTFSFVLKDFTLDLSEFEKSDLYLTMRVFLENKDGSENVLDFTSEGQIELTSGGDCDKQEANWSVPKLGLKSGWNNIRLQLSDAANDSGLTLSNINYFRFYSRKAGDSEYQVKIEDVQITSLKEESVVSTYFSDGMMFTQNKPMTVFGYAAASGLQVTAKLKKENGTVLEEKEASSADDGFWSLAFSGRAGGYDRYLIEIYVDGKLEKTINQILIGELWLAAGQSNMEFFVLQTIPDYDYDLIPLNEYVRFFDEPLVPGGVASTLPASPAKEIEGARWADGSNAVDVKYVSAIAYYMSLQLQEALNVPVGFINAAKGASVIESWLPREVVENDSVIRETLQSRNLYKTEEQLAKTSANWTYLTTLYNAKIAPLAGVNISGMLWYQGESNIKYADEDGYNTFYQKSLEGLIASYSKLFGYQDGEMPFVCAHLAPYNYSGIRADYDTVLASFSEMLSNVAAGTGAKMIQIPIYDLALNFRDPPINNPDPIHPNSKHEVAARFGTAVLSGVYGEGDATAANAPVVKSCRINGNRIEITFDHVGSGLAVIGGGNTLHGFAVCGADRVFVQADAQILSADTVAVSSNQVASPVAATYAWSSFNMNSNLCNSAGIPAVPYRSDKVKSVYYQSMDWGYCDSENTWDAKITLDAGYKPAFRSSDNAVVSITEEDKREGSAAVRVSYTTAENRTAALSPVLDYGGMVNLYPHYSGITLHVKNPENRTKRLSLILEAGGERYYAAVTEGDRLSTEYVLATGDYRDYTFNFARLVNAEGKVLRNSLTVLKTLTALTVTVSDSADGEILLDDIFLRADRLPAPGAEHDPLTEEIEDTTPGSPDKNGNIWLSDADSTAGWTATGTTVKTDTENKTQGKASVGATAQGGVLRQIAFRTASPIDISDYDYFEFDVYFSNMEWFNACNSMMWELTSSGGPDQESDRYMKGYLSKNCPAFYDAAVSGTKTGAWYHMRLVLGAAQTQARGGLKQKSFNFFRFFTVGAKNVPDFEIRFDNLKFTKEPGGEAVVAGDPSYGRLIDDSSMWMTDGDSLSFWSASGAEVVQSTSDKTQGSGAVGVTAKGGLLKQIAFVPKTALDISDYQYLEFDAFFSNLDWYPNCGGTMFELTSAGTCDKESNRYTKSSMLEASPSFAAAIEAGGREGKWYHFKLNLDRPHSSVKGGLNKKAFNYFRFYTTNLKAGTRDYTLLLDNMKFTKGEKAAAIVKTDQYLIINNGDSAAGWSSPGQEVMLDTKDKTEGSASVTVTAKNGILKELAYRPAEPIDLSAYRYLKFDLFLSDIRCLSTSTGFMVELTSSGTCDNASNRYMKSAILAACPELAADLASGSTGNKWYSFCFNLEKPQNQVKGGLDKKAFNYFRIYFLGSPAGTPDCVVKLDHLRVTVDGVSKETSGAASNQVINFSGSNTNYQNVGNKVNGGLLAEPLTPAPTNLITAAIVVGVVFVVAVMALALVLILYHVKKKKLR